MMYAYFGNNSSRPIWAEIQWTGWLLDGGLPLIIAYALALSVALRWPSELRDRRGRRPDLLAWACSLVGYSIGAIALTFSTAPVRWDRRAGFLAAQRHSLAASRQAASTIGEEMILPRPPSGDGSTPSWGGARGWLVREGAMRLSHVNGGGCGVRWRTFGGCRRSRGSWCLSPDWMRLAAGYIGFAQPVVSARIPHARRRPRDPGGHA